MVTKIIWIFVISNSLVLVYGAINYYLSERNNNEAQQD